MDIALALKILRPDAIPGVDYLLRKDANDEFASVYQWITSVPMPSDEEMKASLDAHAAYLESQSYRELRAAEYPPVGDQLDALWKGGGAADAMKAEIFAVKEKYPKPETPTEPPQE